MISNVAVFNPADTTDLAPPIPAGLKPMLYPLFLGEDVWIRCNPAVLLLFGFSFKC